MESALGEALKTLRPRKKNTRTIRVCGCGVPMIWTFFFPYAERYCLNCGNSGGMLGTGESVLATRELIFQKRLVDAIWKVLYSRKGMMPRGRFGRVNCKKCGDNHRAHATKAETEWDEIASKHLHIFEGVFALTKED